MIVKITPGKLNGTISAPPSKSFLHRLLICAALSKGESQIGNQAESQDILATKDCIQALNQKPAKNIIPVFNCRESGSTLRFFVPIALAIHGKALFTGAPRLMERGIGIYEDLFTERNIEVSKDTNGLLLTGRLTSGDYSVPGGVSSQYISGLLFALPLLKGNSTIKVIPPIESRAYIDLTLAVLKQAGIKITEKEKNTFEIKGSQKYKTLKCDAEGDWSNAAFFYALNHFGNNIEITGLNKGSGQGDKVCVKDFDLLESAGSSVSIAESIDLGPVLMAYAAAKHGGTLTDTARLRIKESDRALVMKEELTKFGADITVNENDVIINPVTLHSPTAPLNGHNDHRIVMSLAVLATIYGGEIEGAEAVNKSFPDFFDKLRSLGCNVEIR